MAVNDIRSNLRSDIAYRETVASDDTFLGGIIDTRNHELGLMFTFMINAYTAGEVTFRILESDDSTWQLPNVQEVPVEKLIGAIPGPLNALTPIPPSPLDTDVTAPIPTVGVYSNKRYVRVEATTTGGGDMSILVLATQATECAPEQANDDAGVLVP